MKFCVFSGFLGSGKTTTMMALTEYYSEHCGKAAMISNDLGHGVSLADNQLAQLKGCNALQITEDCICYQNETLAGKLRTLENEGCELVISDIPGFGVGALEHVYHGLNEKYSGSFELAPFTVLVEPATVRRLMADEGGDLAYIYRTQLMEADLIVLNKIDTVTMAEQEELCLWLESAYPMAKLVCISARKGIGLDNLAAALQEGKASMRRPDIGYGGGDFMRAMSRISEYYLQYYAVVCCRDFDGNEYLKALGRRINSDITAGDFAMPHLKLLAWEGEGDYAKLDLVGNDRPIEVNHSFLHRCVDMAVIINCSALCPAKELEPLILTALEDVSNEFDLEITIHRKEALAMGIQE